MAVDMREADDEEQIQIKLLQLVKINTDENLEMFARWLKNWQLLKVPPQVITAVQNAAAACSV